MFNRILICLALFLVCSVDAFGQAPGPKTTTRTVDVHKVDFNKVNYRVGPDLKGLSKDDFKVLSVRFSDLAGDGQDEAVVHASWSFARYGGNGYGYFVDLFTVVRNRLVRLTRLDGGGKSDDFKIVLLDVKNSQLVVRQCELTRSDYKQFFTTLKYEWNGERLIEVDRKRTQAEDCWGV